ncbi:MAG: Crp/Fnr family transcriptional regulator [Cryomorphaceae bacterium]|nr:Crp/Fnr family transcriptional regulator [Cryomorphaceae bacterium]
MSNSQIESNCFACANSNCLVKHVDKEWQDKISNQKTHLRYPKGQSIFREGSRVFGAYFIQEGKVKVVSSNLMGKEQTVRLAGNGHMLGHMGYGSETYPIGAFTLEDSHLCFLDNDILYQAFMHNPRFTFEVMMFYSRELRKSELRAKCFAQMTTEEKVIYAIVYTAETFGICPDKSTIGVDLPRQELANIAGTNADQVSRAISSLKNRSLVKVVGKSLMIPNLQKLKNEIAMYFIGKHQ